MNISSEHDYDSDYANHPPPTDSENEIEIELLPSYYSSRSTAVSTASLSTMIDTHQRSDSIINRQTSNITATPIQTTTTTTTTTPIQTHTPSYSILNQRILFGLSSTANTDINSQKNSLKELGLKRLNPRQHTAVAICRDFSLIIIMKYLYTLWKSCYFMINDDSYNSNSNNNYNSLNFTTVRASEFFLAGIWCIVSGYLSYSILDGLMVRWIVMYAISAAVVRMLSMSLFIIMLVELISFMFNTIDNDYCLPTWILISCVMTLIYIIQNFVTSNLRLDEHLLNDELNNEGGVPNDDVVVDGDDDDGEDEDEEEEDITLDDVVHDGHDLEIQPNNRKHLKVKELKIKRTVDLYNLTVFAVLPIGIASFITMIGLLRLLLILRLEITVEFNKIVSNVKI